MRMLSDGLYFPLICLVLLLPALNGCDIFGIHERDEILESEADIVLGERVKQIHLGDSIQHVEEIYGQPEHLFRGVASGYFRSFFVYQYYRNEVGGVVLYLHSKKDRFGEAIHNSIVDLISIQASSSVEPDSIYSPFEGTTKHGIGLGSNKAELLDALGKPDSTSTIHMKYGPPKHTWFYCNESGGERNEINIGIREDSVFLISFGHYLPFEEPEAKDCEWLNT